MAESDIDNISIKKEEMNGLRIIFLLQKIAPNAVRVLFDKEFQPSGGLERHLKLNRFTVLEPLKIRRILNLTQWGCLFPMSGTVSSTAFDLTLMICLIRHLTPIQIGDNLPHQSDISDGADLTRLKYYRNIFVHHDCCTLTDEDFEIYWKDICQAILRVGGPQFQTICEELKDRILTNSDKEILVEITNLESTLVPQALQKVHEEKLQTCREVEDNVVKTKDVEMKTQRKVPAIVKSNEEINYLRIINLLMKVAPYAVRVKFDKVFHPKDELEKTLRQNKFRVLKPLKRKGIINENQWNLLFPMSGTGSSATFDLTLMICLIRHLTPIQIGDILPQQSDVSSGADLSRLKYYRNKFVHHDDCILTDRYFEIYWSDICQAILRLGGPHFQQICTDVKDMTLNNIEKEKLIEIRHFKKTSTYVPKALQNIHEELINEWRTEDKNVVKTRAIIRIEELLKYTDVIVAVGPSGCGKSTAIHHVALCLHNQEGFDILPVHEPRDIIEYCEPKHKQVFVINDVCGKSTLDIGLINRWTTLSSDIKQIIEDHKIKILLSCRKNIYRDRSFARVELLSNTSCDFVSSYSLTEIERNQIARVYLTEKEIIDLKNSELVEKNSFFPLLCCLYSKQKLTSVHNFFANFISVIKSDLDLFRTASDKKTLATMCLFIVFNNSLNENMLVRSDSMTELLENICDHFDIQTHFLIRAVKSELEKLEMSYVKKTVNTYRIFHDKIYDIFLQFCGEHFFDLVLEVAHRDVIRNKFVLESIQNEKQNITMENIVITVPCLRENHYFDRILKDIKKGVFNDIFLNTQFRYFTFRNKFFKHLRHTLDIKKVLLDVSSEELSNMLLSMTRQGYWDMVPILLTDHVDVNVRDSEGKKESPLFCACKNGQTDIVKLLLDHKSDPNICNYISESSLFVAARGSYENIVKLLLEHKSDPNICNNQNMSPLLVASANGYVDIVRLLLENNCDPNICNNRKESPLFIASKENHTDIVKLLLEHNCDPNICNDSNETPLCIASKENPIDIVDLFLEYKCDPNICYERKESPLFIASKKNHIDIVKLLLEHNCDPNICNDKKESPLFSACKNGQTDIVKLLLDHKSDPNICNYISESSLFVATKGSYENIVKLLLEHKCDPNICNNQNMSPLLVASENGHFDIVRLLLENNCDPNICNDTNETVVFIASKKGHIGIVKLLLEQHCDPNICNCKNESALYIASKKGHTDIVRLLLEHNCDPNMCNARNESPLFVASKKGHIGTVKLLLKHNSNPNICTDTNESPLSIASRLGHTDIVEMLLQYNSEHGICDLKK